MLKSLRSNINIHAKVAVCLPTDHTSDARCRQRIYGVWSPILGDANGFEWFRRHQFCELWIMGFKIWGGSGIIAGGAMGIYYLDDIWYRWLWNKYAGSQIGILKGQLTLRYAPPIINRISPLCISFTLWKEITWVVVW